MAIALSKLTATRQGLQESKQLAFVHSRLNPLTGPEVRDGIRRTACSQSHRKVAEGPAKDRVFKALDICHSEEMPRPAILTFELQQDLGEDINVRLRRELSCVSLCVTVTSGSGQRDAAASLRRGHRPRLPALDLVASRLSEAPKAGAVQVLQVWRLT